MAHVPCRLTWKERSLKWRKRSNNGGSSKHRLGPRGERIAVKGCVMALHGHLLVFLLQYLNTTSKSVSKINKNDFPYLLFSRLRRRKATSLQGEDPPNLCTYENLRLLCGFHLHSLGYIRKSSMAQVWSAFADLSNVPQTTVCLFMCPWIPRKHPKILQDMICNSTLPTCSLPVLVHSCPHCAMKKCQSTQGRWIRLPSKSCDCFVAVCCTAHSGPNGWVHWITATLTIFEARHQLTTDTTS